MRSPPYRTLRFGILALLLMTAATQAQPIVLEGIRTGLHESYTRVVLDLSGPTEYSAETLENPARLILHLESTQPSNNIEEQSLTGVPAGKIIIDEQSDLGSRIIFEYSRAMDTEIFRLPPASGRGHRIVIDFLAQAASNPIAETS